MKKIALYYHGGSQNHGCEAIVRSTAKLLGNDCVLYSMAPEEDEKYGLKKILNLKSDTIRKLGKIESIAVAISHKISGDDYAYTVRTHKQFFDNVNKGDVFLSVGGDNYCYEGKDILGYYNKKIHAKGAKTVLWGCSFEPSDLTDKIACDLQRYDLIVAREKISYDVLHTVNPNTILLPDPAFVLECEEFLLPETFIVGKMIGINISPLIGNYGNKELIIDNYRTLIRYILSQMEYNIALIPHVVTVGSNDCETLGELYSEFKDTNRVLLIEDMNCSKLKYVISKCSLFIGARTHTTIGAYSTCVPTLVVGYSVKAVGIAKDLFGDESHYVIPVQTMKNDTDLLDAFIWLHENSDCIRKHLTELMPGYKKQLSVIIKKIMNL